MLNENTHSIASERLKSVTIPAEGNSTNSVYMCVHAHTLICVCVCKGHKLDFLQVYNFIRVKKTTCILPFRSWHSRKPNSEFCNGKLVEFLTSFSMHPILIEPGCTWTWPMVTFWEKKVETSERKDKARGSRTWKDLNYELKSGVNWTDLLKLESSLNSSFYPY